MLWWRFSISSKNAIGFEDTQKGITALQNAKIPHVLVNTTEDAHLKSLKGALPL